MVEANQQFFFSPIKKSSWVFILSHFPVIKDMWISAVMDLKVLSMETSYENLHAAVFMFVLVLYILILSVPQYSSQWWSDGKLERKWKEVFMAHFEALPWHLFAKPEEDDWTSVSEYSVKIETKYKLEVLLLESPCLLMLLLCYITGDLLDIETENIIPVDLNSFLYWDAFLLAKFYTKLGDLEKSEHYHNVAEQWKAAVTAIHWNEGIGTWLDYDIRNNKPREYFYPSNLAPLWTLCYDLVRIMMNWLMYCIMSMNLDISQATWNAITSPMNCYTSTSCVIIICTTAVSVCWPLLGFSTIHVCPYLLSSSF